ncbi:MAG: TSUP family transporter [Pseudomonadota bacterium]
MLETLLPADLSAGAALVLVGASFVTSLITAAFGIGGGIALLAVMANLVPPAALIPVHGVVQVGSNAGRAMLMLGATRWAVVLPFVLGGLVGALLGGSVSLTLPPPVLSLLVGIFVLGMLYVKLPLPGGGLPLSVATPAAGGITSLLTMFVGATGPFVAAYLHRVALAREAHVATFSVMMTLQHLLKVTVFGLLGFAFAPWAPLMAAMIATGFLGTVVGRRILLSLDEARFRTILKALLTLLALRLLLVGLLGLTAA